MHQAAGDVDQWFTGADPIAFRIHQIDVEACPPRGGGGLQPIRHQPRSGNDRTAHEHRVGHAFVAEPGDDLRVRLK